jgi:glycerophosphoryl diester phosphodiesterase
VVGAISVNAFKITPAGVITQIIDATGAGAGSRRSSGHVTSASAIIVRTSDRTNESRPDGAHPGAGATNYRRWSNNPWSVVEEGGQIKAGDWTKADREKLEQLVKDAHKRKLWIRFYTLNGHAPELSATNGWTRSYNFGSLEAVQERWRAAIKAGVDFIATDQYEDFARELSHK